MKGPTRFSCGLRVLAGSFREFLKPASYVYYVREDHDFSCLPDE